MITCYNCGKQVSDETLICPECGALVRRYEVPRQTPETDQPLAYQPVRQSAAQQAQPGRFYFTGGFKVWFWLCMVFFIIYTFSFAVTGLSFLQNNQASQMLTQLYSDMGVNLVQTFGSLDQAGLYMLINAGGCLVAGVLLLLVYTTRQPKFLLVQLGGSALAGIALAVLVGINLICLAVVVCACVTLLLLRRQLPRRKE